MSDTTAINFDGGLTDMNVGAAPAVRLRVQTALRWMAIIGQSAAVALVYWGFGFDLPLAPVLGVIGLAIALNVVLQWFFRAIIC